MLASRLTSAAPAPVLPLLQSSKTTTSTSILRSTNLSRSPQRQQQSRDFRLLSSCLEPGPQREQGRHRILKSKNVEALNRRLLLNRRVTVHVGHSSIKTFMCSPFHERKYMINLQKLRQDSSRTTINQARGNQGSFGDSPKAGTDRRKGRTFSNDGAQFSNLEITNWKIFKHDSGILDKRQAAYNISVNAFKGHRSPFSEFESPGAQLFSKQPAKSHLGPSTLLSQNANVPYITDSELYLDGRTLKEELDVYQPFQHNEPDGHLPLTPDPVEEALSEYDQKWEPQPFRYNEPDGHFPPPPDPVEEALSEYDQKWEPKPFRYNEPDGHFPPPPDPVDKALSEYDQKWEPKPFRYNEPDGHLPLAPDTVGEALSEYDQKWEPKPFRYNEPDGHLPLTPDPVKKALSDYDQKWEPQPQNDNFFFDEDDKSGHLTQPKSSISKSSVIPVNPNLDMTKQTRLDGLEAGHVKELAASDHSEIALDPKLNCSSEMFPDRISSAKDNMLKQKTLTGNFARDFPEEYATSWKSDGRALMPKNAQSETATKCSPKTQTRPASEFSRKPDTPRLQPSLERYRAVRLATSYPQDLYSEDPVGLEVSYAKECAEQGNPEPPIYVSSYGVGLPRATKVESKRKAKTEEPVKKKAIDTQHRQPIDHLCAATKTSAAPKSKEHQPSKETRNALPTQNLTLYKILAYDPDTQSILTTETASIVPPGDQMPLSPAIVLLRLSKPAKFLPHIAPLLEEGYEIASGNGGVLVFRKVRDGPPSMPPAVKSESHAPARKMTNPIDGMQSIRPATGNFASPTGFVNHDLPEHQSEPFKSGIDVRREERIFSGRGSGWQDQEKREKDTRGGKGKRAKRLLIGAAWVGGLTYAAGIVTEFFRTGGIDGKGPAGL